MTSHAFFGLELELPATFENRSVVLFVAPRIALMSARTPNVAPLTVAVVPGFASSAASAEAALAAHVASLGKLSKSFEAGELKRADGLAVIECSDVTSERVPVRMVCGLLLVDGKAVLTTATCPAELFVEQRDEMHRIVRSVQPQKGTTP